MLNTISYLAEKSKPFQSKNVSEDLTDKFNKLYPSWPMMIATLISLILVMIILYFLMYKPVKKSIAKRQKYIQDNIDEAEKAKLSSEEILAKVNEKLQKAHDEATRIVVEAKHRGDSVYDSYVKRAKNEEARIVNSAKANMAAQQQKLLEENKKQIASAATLLSRKILNEEVNPEIENKIIDEFLKGEE
ncbi:F0F1 ATP synthase subunit B [Mycoplasma sp. CSL7475-4]|uniref:F0F1 ATP synthase subunit B n=1 Tax=Mycoplasma sp. CSL7475-4 TaxID=2973942 RepID=UPI00216AFA56|nr:F0F1 ATP synthase subunit B [Mycoplasma sp. CSL7475-4]MCS4537101.1 F0F1 ATP synthase subunit B [Mycoplasma sp. CSL7475-4]